MQIPYDTGKVKIGLHYMPPVRYDPDPDMERLQRSLIRSPKRQVQAYRRYLLASCNEALLWVASLCLFMALIKAPAIWSFFATA